MLKLEQQRKETRHYTELWMYLIFKLKLTVVYIYVYFEIYKLVKKYYFGLRVFLAWCNIFGLQSNILANQYGNVKYLKYLCHIRQLSLR